MITEREALLPCPFCGDATPEPPKAVVTHEMVEAGALRLAAINGNRPDAWKHYEDDARECLVAALSATPPEDANHG